MEVQMANKKEEYDALENLSEKDLWCQDLDGFVEEWENQLREDAEYQKTIRNTNRRRSKKIGAGKTTGKGRARDDDDFEIKPAKGLKPNPNKGVVKVETKPHQRFLERFAAKPKPNPTNLDGADDSETSGLSDDDFAELATAKPTIKKTSRAPSEQPGPENGRAKRVAATAPKKWIIEDDEESGSDDGKFLGDVGDMVKGIGSGDAIDTTAANGRVSLFAMSRPSTSHADRPTSSSGLPKLKHKASRAFELSDNDETNYELLARSSPHRSAPAPKDALDSFLSDDDDLPVVTKKAPGRPAVKAAPKAAPKPRAPVAKKAAAVSQPKPVTLSPAAKAYAAKQNKLKQPAKKNVLSDEEGDDIVTDDADSPPPKPPGRGRPARAAVAKAKKPIYIDSDEEDVDMDESAVVEDEQSEEDFDDSD
jgi:DNA topoisomerase-2